MERVEADKCSSEVGDPLGDVLEVAEIPDTPVSSGTDRIEVQGKPPGPSLLQFRRQVAGVGSDDDLCRFPQEAVASREDIPRVFRFNGKIIVPDIPSYPILQDYLDIPYALDVPP